MKGNDAAPLNNSEINVMENHTMVNWCNLRLMQSFQSIHFAWAAAQTECQETIIYSYIMLQHWQKLYSSALAKLFIQSRNKISNISCRVDEPLKVEQNIYKKATIPQELDRRR